MVVEGSLLGSIELIFSTSPIILTQVGWRLRGEGGGVGNQENGDRGRGGVGGGKEALGEGGKKVLSKNKY